MPSTKLVKFAAVSTIFLTYSVPCFAAGEAAKSCILKAVEAASKLPGTQVKKSSTRPLPVEQLATWRGQSKPIMVDIDFISPDETGRYSYICATSRSGQAFVRRVP